MSFLATKEATVRNLNVRISRTGVEEGITKFSVEGFAFLIVPLVHGTRARFRGGRGGMSGVGEGIKCSLPYTDEKH